MFEGVIGQNFLIIKEIFLTSAKSVNPDEMQHFVALYVGLQYLQKYSFLGVQNAAYKPMCVMALNLVMIPIFCQY